MREIIIAALLVLATQSEASPYFRILDISKPQISAGAFIDPTDTGNTSYGSMLALATHSNRDGCLLPSISCEDWSPLGVGFATKSGKTIFALGPSFNLAPLAKALLFKAFNAVTGPESYQGVKSALSSESLDRQDISLSFGPAWAVVPQDAWKGYFRCFAGAAWRF